jgi:hypothetical protein
MGQAPFTSQYDMSGFHRQLAWVHAVSVAWAPQVSSQVVVVDPSDATPESDETNNTRVQPITVQ